MLVGVARAVTAVYVISQVCFAIPATIGVNSLVG